MRIKKKQKKHSIGGHSCENKTADAVYCYFFVRMRFQFKLLREMFEDLPEKFWKEKGPSHFSFHFTFFIGDHKSWLAKGIMGTKNREVKTPWHTSTEHTVSRDHFLSRTEFQ